MPDLDIGKLIGYVELDDSGVAKGAKSAEDKIEDLGKSGAGLAKAAGIGIGLAVAGGLVGALDIQASSAKLTAQLDLTATESERYGGIAGRLYSGAFGENMDEVNEGIRQVTLNIGGMAEASDADLERVTGKVLNLSQTFDQDLGQTTRAVGTLLRNGLAKDADEALDLLTRGFQNGTNTADDLLDTVSEYSVQFRKLGLDGTQSLGLLHQGLEGGARDADTVADALKELSIRAIDGSKTTADGFAALGLSADDFAVKFGKGGTTASGALDEVLDRLRNTPDPVAKAQAAVGLFGTKAEDLGAALDNLDLDTAADGMGKVEGAAQRVGDALGGTAAAQFTSVTRSAQQFAVALGQTLLPVVTEVGGTVLDVVSPALGALGDVVGGVADVFDDIPGPVQTAIVILGGLVATRGPISATFDSIKTVATGALENISARALIAREAMAGGAGLTGAISEAATAGSTAARGGLAAFTGLLGGPLGIGIAAVSIGLPLLTSFLGDNDEAAKDTADSYTDLADALAQTGGVIDDTVRRAAAEDLRDSGLLQFADDWGVATSDLVDAALNQGDALDTVRASVEDYIAGLERQRDAIEGDSLGAEANRAAIEGVIDAQRTRLGELENVANQTGDNIATEQELAGAVEGTGDATDQTTRAVEDQKDAYDALKTALDNYLGINMDVDTAQLRVLDGLADLTTKTNEQGTSLDRATQSGRDNEGAILDQIGAIEQLATSTYKQTGSSEAAKAAWDREIGTLRDKLIELGYNRDTVDQLIGRYNNIPTSVWTDVQTNAGTALGTITTLKDRLETIDRGTYYVDVYTTSTGGKALGKGYSAKGNLYSYYAGGGLYDPLAGRDLTPMPAGIAARVPANTWRVVGDRPHGDEFYLPDDDATRTMTLGLEWLRRRGLAAVPLARYADGGIAPGPTAAIPAPGRAPDDRASTTGPAVLFTGPVSLNSQRDALALAEQTEWQRRTRGRRR